MTSDTSPAEGERVLAWARVYAAVQPPHSKNLRHGHWYPVLRDHVPDRVSLKVGAQLVDVPRAVLEIRDKRPPYFALVDRSGKKPTPSDSLNGKRYVVCPSCGHRSELMGRPDMTRCRRCSFWGEVAWWD